MNPAASVPAGRQGGSLLLVLLVSATVLAQEVALLRVLAIAHWHHAAQMIIAVALCGFGAAATLLAVFPGLRQPVAASRAAALYAASVPVSLSLGSAVEFNALAVGWEPAQWLRLFALQAIFVSSILFGALAIQISLALAGPGVGRTYAVNLAGSGIGALAVLPLLTLGPPEQLLAWLALLPAVAAWRGSRRVALLAVAVVVLLPRTEFAMTPYKALEQVRLLPGAEIVETRHHAHARIDLVRAPSLRPVEGLSLSSAAPVPPMTLVTVDGSAAGTLVDGDASFFRDTLTAAPLAMLDVRRALVLGGAGNLHEAALGIERVTRVDGAWTGGNPRAFLAHTDARFDVVWLRLPHSVAMAENALATREAFAAALAVTSADGVVFVSVPVHAPPREELKALLTALAVTPHVQALRSLDLLGIMLRRRALRDSERDALDVFCRTRGFDCIGQGAGARLHEAGHRDYARALAGEPLASRYRLDPASDDAPYFHRFMPWHSVAEGLPADDALQTAALDWGTRIAVVATLQVTVLGLVLLLLPLLTLQRDGSLHGERRFALWHFLAIGGAYAAIEMAFLGRLTLIMGRPEYAFGAVLCAFLVASGIGSLSGARIRHGAWAAAVIALCSLPLLDAVRSLPLALLLAVVVAMPMGIPFPAGLRRLDRRAPALVPWALAANGCASVATFSAAPLLASDIGFSGLILGGALIYLLVGAADRARTR
jgi:hypothetical protein